MGEPFEGIERAFSSAMGTFADMERVASEKKYGTLAGLAVLLLTALLCTAWVWRNAEQKRASENHFSEKVNLALRRTAHHLLMQAGDSVSTIPPVSRTDAETWQVQFSRAFNYDRLPPLLQQSLELHEITRNYDVEVVKCTDNALQLGYNFFDFKQDTTVPCGGREMQAGCYNLRVRFLPEAQLARNTVFIWIFAVSGLLTGIFLTARNRRKTDMEPPAEIPSGNILLGQSMLHLTNQTLFSAGQQHKLTYREAKLLHLFATKPNQLLERDFILQSVWADEGILVGRSVDVFVSRLRKLLRDDPTVKITAVHGIGYRMEVVGV